MQYPLPDFLPGTLTLARGSPRDYRELEAFHYLPGRPATWAAVWNIFYTPFPSPRETQAHLESIKRLIAVGVLSYSTPNCRPRERFFNRSGFSRKENCEFVNANLRTISRVVVHPQFRSLGLSSLLVRCICDNCNTRYVEALAMMGRAHPFFDRAGMTRIDPIADEPVYFIFDREKPQ